MSRRARNRFSSDRRERSVYPSRRVGGSAYATDSFSVPRRMGTVLSVFLFLAVVFFLRLFYLQVMVSDTYTAMAVESRTISFSTTPRRGTIYDRNGIVLATSVDATTIYANPAEVTDPMGEAAQLAALLGGEINDYATKLGNRDTTFVYIKRQADVEVAEQVKTLNLAGVYFIADTRRDYPNGSVGAQVVGYCNVDGEGITGLELQYNDILKGTPGTYVAERGESGTPIPGGVHQEVPAVDGTDIMISLDIKLQNCVEQILAEDSAPMGPADGSSIIMDSETGEILAICSLPYMDPNNMAESATGSDQVKAITQAYEPGSIFKTVSVLRILENKTMGPDDELFCPATIEADGYTVSDAHERGDATFTLRQILDQSSNVGVSLATEKMGFDELYDAILDYNFHKSTGVDYPGEAIGFLQPFESWAKITGYNISFGQGLSVTPLQLVRFYGAIMNNGIEVTPHFLISKPQTQETITYPRDRVTKDQEALETLRGMLRTVVSDGTGEAAAIEGFEVAGKTSTAEIAADGGYKNGVYNLGFIGFIDHSNSPLVCFVGLNEVYGMAQTTHIFNDIMEKAIELYNISPE